ncbi:CDP-glucose 4,6-dehydratase [Herbaspirillum seropedicae]|uniref:CDP-glucose 4,6-dehydratase n=1 Tax=Herbaspirillum seropedicae TaxID=964 RepID=UPI003FCD7526
MEGMGAMIKPEFWAGRRVFLTGHTGFKGSWLSLWLTEMGAKVTGMGLAPETTPDLFNVARADSGMTSVIGDIRTADLVLKTMQAAKPDIVIHMAAQPLVRYSYAEPVETYSTNVMGTVHVLEAVRKTPGVRAVVVVTSDKCYQNNNLDRAFLEEDAMGGHDPYSSSKGCAELVTTAYRSSYFSPSDYANHGVAIASARAGNVIGGGDWALDRLIPDVMRAITDGQSVRIRSPQAVRPWQHVLEPLAGYLILAQSLYEQGTDFAEGWNFGPPANEAKPVRWIVEMLVNLWGPQARWTQDEGIHPHEAHLLMLDSTKAHKKLGWRPVWTLEQTLSRIVDWHRAQLAGADMHAYCLEEIKAYNREAAMSA